MINVPANLFACMYYIKYKLNNVLDLKLALQSMSIDMEKQANNSSCL